MEILAPKNALITTLEKALDEVDPHWKLYPGLIITGSWPGEDDKDFVLGTMARVRNEDKPILGICLGHQIIGMTRGGNLEKLSERRVGMHWVEATRSMETFWHDYYIRGVSGRDYYENGNIISTQFHPEYQSSKDKPHKILIKFLDLCRK